MASFGTELKRLRTAAGLSPEQLAERAGLTAACICATERGASSPLHGTVQRLAKALGVGLSVFDGCCVPQETRKREQARAVS